MYSNKEIWNVTYPIFLGLLAQNVINVTDTAFLGHVSEVALGASAMGGLLYICIYTVAFGFSVGYTYIYLSRGVTARGITMPSARLCGKVPPSVSPWRWCYWG